MRRSEWLVRLTLVFCLAYGVVAVQNRDHQKFPFFSWDLFSKVPRPNYADYSVRFLQGKGFRVPPPVYFEDSRLFGPIPEIQGYAAVQTLGRAIKSGQRERAAALRRRFEATYLNALSGVRYQVVRRLYDIRERVKCRTCFTVEKVIAIYTKR